MKRFAMALLVGLLFLVPATTALAGQSDVVRRGSCSGRSDWKLKLSPEDGRIEVEFEVDQNRNGVPWKVTLRRNGSLVVSTTRRTHAPSGSFSLERVIAGAGGNITAVATRASGERCTARASI
jgi:hypothetical protein